MSRPNVSVVVPVYMGALCLEELVARQAATLDGMGVSWEIVLVDDRSPDPSWAGIKALAAADPRVVGVRLSRNFGQMRAIGAGLAHARGDRVFVMDCDLQDRPEHMPRLAALADEEGADIVFVCRVVRREGLFKRFTAWGYYKVLRFLSPGYLRPGMATYSLLTRDVVRAYVRVADEHAHYLSVLHWLGYRSTVLELAQDPRAAEGSTSYNLRKLIIHALNGIVSQSNRLLYVSTAIGFLFALAAVVQIVVLVYRALFVGIGVEGWASVMVAIWMVGAAVLLSLGVLALYLERVVDRSRMRPLFVVDQLLNGEEATTDGPRVVR